MTLENYSQATEDYLKIILDLSSRYGYATTSKIADAMNIKPASVTGMIKRLAVADPPLVIYRKHHGATLTPAGERAALEILRHHRLLESFLVEVLGFSWDEVHEEAHRLEHVISEKFEERMATVLGNPTHDPHGDPIPSSDLIMPEFATLNISQLEDGQKAVIKRVRLSDAGKLCSLEQMGIRLGTIIVMQGISSLDGNIKFHLDGKTETLVLSPVIADEIFVQLLT